MYYFFYVRGKKNCLDTFPVVSRLMSAGLVGLFSHREFTHKIRV